MRTTLLASAATLALAFALPAEAQTPNNRLPASPSGVTNSTPAAGTLGATNQPGSAPGTGMATPGAGEATATPPDQMAPGAPPSGTQSSGMAPAGQSADQSAMPPAHKRHRMHHAMPQESQQASDSDGSGHWAHQPGTGESGPASNRASNINSADTRSAIAPHLPQPMGGDGAGPVKYLHDADRALEDHKTGLAQQALEMAETRLLDRSTPAGDANQTDQAPAIQQVSEARKALASGDIQAARTAIQTALADRRQSGDMSDARGMGGMSGMGNGDAAMQGSPAPAAPGGSGPAAPGGSGPAAPGGYGNAEAGHVIGSGTGGGPLGTPSQDSAGGAR